MAIDRNNRLDRISQEIRKALSIILQRDLDDPRIGMPTVLSVSVSRDLKYAKVFITFLDKNQPEDINKSIFVLQRASGFVRFLLADRVFLRIIPILFFLYDTSLMKGNRIYQLLTKL